MAVIEESQAAGSVARKEVGTNGSGDGALERSSGAADLMRAHLEDRGFRIDYFPEYHRRYKLDFLITRIEAVHAHVSLGVQVTTHSDDLDMLEQFLDGTRRGVVHKSIYIEINAETVHTGGLQVATSACMAFLFDRRYGHFKCVGLRVFEDCTFHFFDIEENVRRLRRDSVEESARVGEDLAGNIIAYFTDKGFGFIEAGRDQKFFFHIANVVDDELRIQLPSYIPGDVLPVHFKFGGNDGKKYPKAIDVRGNNEDFDDDDFEDDF